MKTAGATVFTVLLLTLPFWVGNPYYLHVAIMAGIFGVLALSLNLLLGYTGQLSLGHAAFFGIGAYTSALLTLRLDWPVWPAMLWRRGRGACGLAHRAPGAEAPGRL